MISYYLDITFTLPHSFFSLHGGNRGGGQGQIGIRGSGSGVGGLGGGVFGLHGGKSETHGGRTYSSFSNSCGGGPSGGHCFAQGPETLHLSSAMLSLSPQKLPS